ncbi:hypothetical protein [Pseudomonas ovata]|uniref:hypothetical protein n=1 Tax=Pseudomonas ovata TaxID=1839709 RepID=UPI000D697D99|nr:hypothetical protein [Pseudomonas ovata]
MHPQKSHSQAHFGIIFTVTSFTVFPEDRPHLQTLFLCELGSGCHQAHTLIVELYDHMQPGRRACEMQVRISRPLLREQADSLNDQRITVSRLLGSAAGVAIKPVSGVASLIAGGATTYQAQNTLRSYHAGDVIFSVQALVSGGIGPQRSLKSILIKPKGGA